ncbi:MAG: Mrp/NBP35 family ATP-binding protein [Chloroflexota bacterium]|nr:Mrp/NBP35 family ATP-binding protein [Chloroflexota bacterium]
MATKEQVEEKLDLVILPVVQRSVMQLNLLRGVEIKDNRMKVTLADAALAPDMREWITSEVQNTLSGLDGIGGIAVDFEEAKPSDVNRVNKVVAVMSGKGGVGKSLVSGLLALSLRRQGKSVGILDADVTGPSIPKMFGVNSRPGGSESGLLPATSKSGIEVISINLLLPNEDDAVIWRGPLIAKSIQQFWEDVLWGKLDYLVVDLPPGTADVPLTVMQSLPLAGVILAFTPQDLTAMVVRKAVNMAKQMSIPVLGLVENMSYFIVPETDTKIEIFGPTKIVEMAAGTGAPILGQIPLDPELAKLCDKGEIEEYDSEVFKQFQEAATRVLSY